MQQLNLDIVKNTKCVCLQDYRELATRVLPK